jgi:type IV pilus assembly protein PilY1
MRNGIVRTVNKFKELIHIMNVKRVVFSLYFFCVLCAFAVRNVNVSGQSLIDYTHYPLSSTNMVPPNVLILMDNSESMHKQAYREDFDPRRNYDGYFKSAYFYSYVNNAYFEINPLGKWNGNFLNWLTMRRIDLARKVLIGGKTPPNSRTGSETDYLLGEDTGLTGYEVLKQYPGGAGIYYPAKAELEIDSTLPVYFGLHKGFIYTGDTPDPFSQPSSQFRIQIKKDALSEPNYFREENGAGLIHKLNGKVRLGFAVFNTDREGSHIINPIGSDLNSIISMIEQHATVSGSPLAESLFECVRYFMQITPFYSHSLSDYEVGNQNDPFFFQEISQHIPCVQSFIILISDGESTYDQNIPASPPLESAGDLRNYDGDDAESFPFPDEGSDYLDDVALWAHTSDLRTGRQELEGLQPITLFTVNATGSGSRLLQDAAKNGGFTDSNGNNLPDLNQEWDSNDDGLPDTCYSTADSSRLGEKLLQIAAQITQSTASESGLTIAPNSLYHESSLFQASYQPSFGEEGEEINWLGFLHALWIDGNGNIREDTDGDKALVYEHDKIIRFTYDDSSGETRAATFRDTDGDGRADRSWPDALLSLQAINPLWEAGKKLALKDAETRQIRTFVDEDKDGEVDFGEFLNFTPDHALELRPYLRAADEEEASEIIQFIRGEMSIHYRNRSKVVEGIEQVWKLGDIVHSSPAFSSHPFENYHLLYGDVTYESFLQRWRERPLTVFAGGNDGMIHAFNGGTYNHGDNPLTPGIIEQGWYDLERQVSHGITMGDEKWAYIPYNLLPHLTWLTRRDYTHVYYVDCKAKVTDVRTFTDRNGNPIDPDHPHGWGTLLIGGTGVGGKAMVFTDDFGSGREERSFAPSYFALDITNPATPQLLWEFTHPKLGFTTGYPAIVRVEAERGLQQPQDDKWFVVFGSGPTGYTGTSNQPACMFVVDLKTGKLARLIELENTTGFLSGSISIDYDLDYNTDIIYTGSSLLSEGEWRGAVYRLSIRSCTDTTCSDQEGWHYSTNPDDWTFSRVLTTLQPITAAPNASLDEKHTLWIFCGTGRYYGFLDHNNRGIQNRFFAIKDPCYRGNCDDELSINDLHDSSGVLVYPDGSVEGTIAASWHDLLDEMDRRQGWYITFSTEGERVLNKPNLLNGILTFTTYTPDLTPCSVEGLSTLYTLYYKTGTAGERALFILNREDVYGESGGGSPPGNGNREEPVEITIPLEGGITSSPVMHIGKNSVILTSSGSSMVTTLPLQPAFQMRSGMESWREE